MNKAIGFLRKLQNLLPRTAPIKLDKALIKDNKTFINNK